MEQLFLKDLQDLMDKKGVSQSEYARAKGVSRQTVNQLFSGKRGLLTESAAELLEYLGVRIRLEPIEEVKDA